MRTSQIPSIDGSDSSRPNSPENDSSAETPSEHSLRTPENSFSPKVEIKGESIDMTVRRDYLKEDEPALISKPTLLEGRHSKSKSTKPAMFTSTLNRPCDFRYDRFSTIVDPVDLALKPEEEPSSSSSAEENGDEGSDEDYSPIELATPVAIRMPIKRPSMVSVVGTTVPQPGPQKFHVTNINTIMINRPKQPTPKPTLKPQIVDTVPMPSSAVPTDYGFPAPRIKPVETITPSSASVFSVEPSSTRSLPGTTNTNAESNLKKKSSMPMLTKFTHARMHSLKNFMKPQSISGPPPAVPSIPPTHQARPSESVSSVFSIGSTHRSRQSVADKLLPPSPRRSLTEPHLPKETETLQRPQTARNPSQGTITTLSNLSQSNVTALPPPVPEISSNWTAKPMPEEHDHSALTKKKSFPSFRRRSGSLGQALRFGNSSKSKLPILDEPLPPVPMVRAPTQESVQTPTLPTPPARTPRQARKSGMMYSPFPPPTQKGEPVGLGLRM